jgi:TetR/AcrR family transcriptional regulator
MPMASRIYPGVPVGPVADPIGCGVLHRYPLRHGPAAFCRFCVRPVFPWPDAPFSQSENLTIRSKLTLEEAGVPVKCESGGKTVAGDATIAHDGVWEWTKRMDVKVNRKKDAGDKTTRIQEANRRILLEAALEVFSAYGFRGTTIDQIAEKAGMSKPNLLYYFKRKQDIYVAVLEETLEAWLQPLHDLDAKGDPVEELRRYITRKIEMSARKPEASRLFANEILHGAPAIMAFLTSTLKKLVDDKSAVIRQWVSEGRLAPIDPYHLIFMIWATTQHYADFDVQVRAVLGNQVDKQGFTQQTAQAVLSLILNGVRPR